MSEQPKILCIDDDTHTSDWIKIMLRGSHVDCIIQSVRTGREAFGRLKSEPYDLCIMEYALPDMTGVQLSTLLRQTGCNVPIMFFTAMNRTIDRQKAEAAGADEYLAKPDALDIFSDAAARLLRRRRPIYMTPTGSSDYAMAA